MNPDLSRRAARAMIALTDLSPRERTRLARAVEPADSWEDLPDWAQAQLERGERILREEAQLPLPPNVATLT